MVLECHILAIIYSLLVSAGTGRTTTIKKLLNEIKPQGKPLHDLVYVNNFGNPDSPIVLYLDRGQGKVLKEKMAHLVETLKQKVPAIFDDDTYKMKRSEIVESLQEKQKQVFKAFEQSVSKAGFQTIQVKVGPYTRPDVAPVIKEKVTSMDELDGLLEGKQITKDEYENYRKEYKESEKGMEEAFKKNRVIETNLREKLSKLNYMTISRPVKFLVDEVREEFLTNKKTLVYLKAVEQNITLEPERFTSAREEKQTEDGQKIIDPFLEYQVNVIVDNTNAKDSPIVIETNPSYKNIFGSIERVMDRNGVWRTDFTKITAGSLLKANGGYFVLNAFDLLVEPNVWPTLKRTMQE